MGVLLAAIVLATAVQSSIGYQVPHGLFPEPQSPGERPYSVPLTFVNGVPTVQFSVGTPQQQFVGIFDTSSAISWVTSESFSTSAEGPRGNTFSHAKSATNRPLQRVLDIDYADGGHVKIRPELDVISFAGGKVKYPGHIIGEAIQVQYASQHVPAANARIGLGDYRELLHSGEKIHDESILNIGISGGTGQHGLLRRENGYISDPSDPCIPDAPNCGSGSPNFRKRAVGDDRTGIGSTSRSPGFRKRAVGDDRTGIGSTSQNPGFRKRSLLTNKSLVKRAAGDDRSSTGYSSSGSPNFVKRSRKAPTFEFQWVFGVDDSMYIGPLYMMPTIAPHGLSPYWKLPVRGFGFSDRSAGSTRWVKKKEQNFSLPNNAFGQIHSSSPHILVPPSLAKSINEKALGAEYDSEAGLYTVDCSLRHRGPWLSVQLAALDAMIPPREYITESTFNQRCYSSIVDGQDDTNVYLGGPFFRSFYLVFDFEHQKVGVAQSAANPGQLGVLHANSA